MALALPIEIEIHRRRSRRPEAMRRGGELLAAGAAGATFAVVAERARVRRRRRRGKHHHPPRVYDEVTLARKVESEIFRPAGAPKGTVDVNVHDQVVELRGVVARAELITELEQAAAEVEGVARVENLLHMPGEPAKHAPPSTPGEVRARADARHHAA